MNCLFTGVALLFAPALFAQKKPIDLEVASNWVSFRDINGKAGMISNNGQYCAWSYAQFKQDKEYTVLSDIRTGRRWEFTGNNFFFTEDSRYFTGRLRGDTLVLVKLGTNSVEYLPGATSFSLAENEKNTYLVFRTGGQESALKLMDLRTRKEQRYTGVGEYWVNGQGSYLVAKQAEGLLVLNLLDGTERKIPETGVVNMLTFSGKGDAFCYLSGPQEDRVLKYGTVTSATPETLCSARSEGVPANMRLAGFSMLKFTEEESGILFELQYTHAAPAAGGDVITKAINIWSYKDKVLQQAQPGEMPNKFTALVFPGTKKMILLEDEQFGIEYGGGPKGRYVILSSWINYSEFYWNKQIKKSILLNLTDGSRKELCALGYPATYPEFSPGGRFVAWYDHQQKSYCCYEISTGQTRLVSRQVDEPLVLWRRGEADKLRDNSPYGIAAWLQHDEALLIYSSDDIWQLDPLGKKAALNLTNGYGKKQDIRFRVLKGNDQDPMTLGGYWITFAFNRNTKQNGFWTIRPGVQADPEKKVMDDHAWYFYPTAPIVPENSGVDAASCRPVKAKQAEGFIARRMSSTETPNLVYSADLKTWKQVSQLTVPAEYNMVQAELVTYTLPDGFPAQGILHKPQDFDPSKKYPVIFNYYERRSECLNVFRVPELSWHNVNIPWFVSRGYLVFEPDFYYKTGKTYQSIVNAVTAATKKLATLPYVDTARMGAQGQSFGGYETNVIATGTHLFKAACEMAGPTDIISEYGSMRPSGLSNQSSPDVGQRNLAVFPWERPEVFIENSPVFHVGRMTTPLLICHNRGDGAILFPQAVELYLAMRRAGKTGWMLEYDDEDHELREQPNQLDFTIRMEQFFDHYLKGKPAPSWMTQGIPAKLKGIKTGFQPDTGGNCSASCGICNAHTLRLNTNTNNSTTSLNK